MKGLPDLPNPDTQTDWHRDGEGDAAYTIALVWKIQAEAYAKGFKDALEMAAGK